MNLKFRTDSQRQEPLKSPRTMTPENNNKLNFSKMYHHSELQNFIRTYRKQVELPINYQTSIFNSKTPQRCLQHNNVITLYCITDKKPLCVHCMYQISTHKKHEVIPLNKAGTTLKEQLSTYTKNISTSIFPMINHLIKKNQINLQHSEKEMTDLINTVNKFYSDLSQYISNKRNQQLNKYEALRNKLKHEYSNYSKQLIRISLYSNEKLKEITERSSDEHILYNHNLAMYLNKMGLILNESRCEYKQFQINQLYKKMESFLITFRESINFNTSISKQQIKNEKDVSLSLKKQKSKWINRKSELNLNNFPKNEGYKNIKSPFTPRQNINNTCSPKKQMTCKYFQKDRSKEKDKQTFSKTMNTRKSQSKLIGSKILI